MAIRKNRKCFECKQMFPSSQLIEYASLTSNISHSYCPTCLKLKQDRDLFSQTVCMIFGTKTPGPRMWTERKRLMENYGYSDEVIIDCLNYVYKVENHKVDIESLYLVTPVSVDRMMQYKRKNGRIGGTMPKYEKHLIPVSKEPEKELNLIDPDNLTEWD